MVPIILKGMPRLLTDVTKRGGECKKKHLDFGVAGTSSRLHSRQQHLQLPTLDRCPGRNNISGWVGGAEGGEKAWPSLG